MHKLNTISLIFPQSAINRDILETSNIIRKNHASHLDLRGVCLFLDDLRE